MLTRAIRFSALRLIPLLLPVAAAPCAVLVLLLAPTPARAASFVFQSSFFSGATGPASGTLVTAPGTGGPGDQILLSEIVFFDFSHTFAPGTTIVFDTNDLAGITGASGLNVSADGLGLASGGWFAIDEGDARLRMVTNADDVNDNYRVDFPSTTSNGFYGGAFGGWVLVPEPSTGLLLGVGLTLLAWRRRVKIEVRSMSSRAALLCFTGL